MVQKVKKDKTPQQAYLALTRLCARGERCTVDAARLMRNWGVAATDAQQIVNRLVSERFIDDKRYSQSFVREKINLSHWGQGKIISALKAKGIRSDYIAEALEQLSETDTESRLKTLLLKKMRTTKSKNSADLRAKLFRYAASQGYDFSQIRDIVESIVKEDNGCEYFD